MNKTASSATLKMESIQCTITGCTCECFSPGKNQLRVCESCDHGWVVHAADKMTYRNSTGGSIIPTASPQLSPQQPGGKSVAAAAAAASTGVVQVEIVQPNIVFDIASLMLYGSQATPIRLKILLDRLFSVLQHDDVLQVLHSFGWSYEDYARGYILHDSSGRVLDKWSMATYEDEQLILQQFLRFGETKSIAQELITREGWERNRASSTPGAGGPLAQKTESDIKKFIERSNNIGMQSFIKGYDAAQQLLSRTFMYPHLATAGFARLLTPTLFHGLAPAAAAAAAAAASGAPRDASQVVLQTTSTLTSPMVRSPLRSLQTMEPFDYRKDQIGGLKIGGNATSLDGSNIAKWDSRALLNLAIGSAGGIAMPQGPHLPLTIKSEALDKLAKSSGNTDLKQSRDSSNIAECAINYSIKDRQRASISSLNLNHLTSSLANVAVASTHLISASNGIQSHIMSASSNPSGTSSYVNQKLKHLRKSSNPMKRPWQPTPGYGGTLISPSGKKRVLCTACHKTFCDKGALKIHYSAVHLKEMHRCTVEGCTMMFSSRRSRNRHSANPNPKLHMPQTVRRKLPDNMASSLAMSLEEGSEGMHMYSQHPDDDISIHSSSQPVVLDDMSNSSIGSMSSGIDTNAVAETSRINGNKDGMIVFPVGADARYFLNTSQPEVVNLSGHHSTVNVNIENQTRMEEVAGGISGDMGLARSSSKRKSAVPTRCPLQSEDVVSDENSVAHDENNSEVMESPEKKMKCLPENQDQEQTISSTHKGEENLAAGEDNNNCSSREDKIHKVLALTCKTKKKKVPTATLR